MRIPRRSFVFMAVLGAGGTLAVAVVAATGLLPGGSRGPVLQYTELVDLGSHEQRGVAIGRFQVRNDGRGELVLDQFRTSCACAGVEREVDGKFLRVQTLRLGAGEQIDLVLRVSVSARVGEEQRSSFSFESNDPVRPHGFVQAVISRVLGGVVTLPAAVLCGDLSVGSAAGKHVLNVYDGGQAGRRIKSVRSTQPQRFRVDFRESAGASQRHETAGGLLGQVEITPITASEGPLDGEVEITLAGEDRHPDLVPVSGRVNSHLGVAPQSVVLPRTVGGQPIYHAEVCVFSHDGTPVSVRVESTDQDLPVEVQSPLRNASQRRVRIEWKPSGDQRPSYVQDRKVRLRVRVGDQEHVRDVQVLLHDAGKSSP
jgi:hypothetical protein